MDAAIWSYKSFAIFFAIITALLIFCFGALHFNKLVISAFMNYLRNEGRECNITLNSVYMSPASQLEGRERKKIMFFALIMVIS